MLVKESIDYQCGDTTLKGYYIFDDQHNKKIPAVIIAHDWSGQTEFAHKKAEKLAELGYLGFALDMYGNGKTGQTTEEKSALIQPLLQDRSLLQRRILSAFDAVKALSPVDPANIGAIGFCFGGLCVLDLARTGADCKGVVSFHGLLNAPDNLTGKTIKSKVLALHGYDDPMVTPDQVMAFGNEMTAANVDWQLHMYGNTMHAFTNPQANDPGFGTVYNKVADMRSWQAMKDFFGEVLG